MTLLFASSKLTFDWLTECLARLLMSIIPYLVFKNAVRYSGVTISGIWVYTYKIGSKDNIFV